MTAAVVLSPTTSILRDRRDAGRALRVTWHASDDLFVLSTWRGETCASSFQLTRTDVPDLIALLARGLAESPAPWSPVSYSPVSGSRPFRIARLLRNLPTRRSGRPHG